VKIVILHDFNGNTSLCFIFAKYLYLSKTKNGSLSPPAVGTTYHRVNPRLIEPKSGKRVCVKNIIFVRFFANFAEKIDIFKKIIFSKYHKSEVKNFFCLIFFKML